jgi:hypothetical protein
LEAEYAPALVIPYEQVEVCVAEPATRPLTGNLSDVSYLSQHETILRFARTTIPEPRSSRDGTETITTPARLSPLKNCLRVARREKRAAQAKR